MVRLVPVPNERSAVGAAVLIPTRLLEVSTLRIGVAAAFCTWKNVAELPSVPGLTTTVPGVPDPVVVPVVIVIPPPLPLVLAAAPPVIATAPPLPVAP